MLHVVCVKSELYAAFLGRDLHLGHGWPQDHNETFHYRLCKDRR